MTATLVSCALLLGPSLARAAVTLISEDRVVRVTKDGEIFCSPEDHEFCLCEPGYFYYPICLQWVPHSYTELEESFGAGFAPMNESVSIVAASASQTSTIGTDTISGTGTAYADWIFDYVEGPPVTTADIASTTALSRAYVTFSVDQPTAYALVGSWDALPPLFRVATFQMQLVQGATTIASIVCEPIDPSFPHWGCFATDVTVQGILAPGTYELQVEGEGVGDPGELGGIPAATTSIDYAFSLTLEPTAALPAVGWLARAVVGLGLLWSGWRFARHRA